MNRRTYVSAAAAAIASLAGCSGLTAPESTPTESPTPEPTATPEPTPTETLDPPISEALVIESSYARDGTMVEVGVEGTARNAGSTALENCLIEVSAEIEGRRFDGETERDRLGPDETWEWSVEFGSEADGMNEPIENIEIRTRADSVE